MWERPLDECAVDLRHFFTILALLKAFNVAFLRDAATCAHCMHGY